MLLSLTPRLFPAPTYQTSDCVAWTFRYVFLVNYLMGDDAVPVKREVSHS